MQTKDKFIAFVDILGFSRIVEELQEGGGGLGRAFDLIEALGSPEGKNKFAAYGPTLCPGSRHNEKTLDFEITQISDCVIVSTEVSPAGAINLVGHCCGIALKLMSKGALCRGKITRGHVYHADNQVVGVAYQQAVSGEKYTRFLRADESEIGTPFIEIDDTVVSYVRDETDNCVREMFRRVTRSDGEYTAIYPFTAMENKPFTTVHPAFDFDPEKWLASVRLSMKMHLARIATFEAALERTNDPKARQKISHYLKGLQPRVERLKAKEARALEILESGEIPWGAVL